MTRIASRWDLLLETKPVPLLEHLLDEVAKLFAKDLARWPLPVEELDVATGAQFAPLLAGERPRPSPAVFAEAYRLAKWELGREIEAYDDYVRNRRYLDRGLSTADFLPLQFISRWLVEQLLGLGEATEGRIKRPQMVKILERVVRLGSR